MTAITQHIAVFLLSVPAVFARKRALEVLSSYASSSNKREALSNSGLAVSDSSSLEFDSLSKILFY